jgi:hypothetical protein
VNDPVRKREAGKEKQEKERDFLLQSALMWVASKPGGKACHISGEAELEVEAEMTDKRRGGPHVRREFGIA